MRQVRQLLEEVLRCVDAAGRAAGALVLDGTSGGLAVGGVVDGYLLAAHGVPVGLGAHGLRRHGDDVGRHVLSAVVGATGAEAERVVRDVARVVG